MRGSFSYAWTKRAKLHATRLSNVGTPWVSLRPRFCDISFMSEEQRPRRGLCRSKMADRQDTHPISTNSDGFGSGDTGPWLH